MKSIVKVKVVVVLVVAIILFSILTLVLVNCGRTYQGINYFNIVADEDDALIAYVPYFVNSGYKSLELVSIKEGKTTSHMHLIKDTQYGIYSPYPIPVGNGNVVLYFMWEHPDYPQAYFFNVSVVSETFEGPFPLESPLPNSSGVSSIQYIKKNNEICMIKGVRTEENLTASIRNCYYAEIDLDSGVQESFLLDGFLDGNGVSGMAVGADGRIHILDSEGQYQVLVKEDGGLRVVMERTDIGNVTPVPSLSIPLFQDVDGRYVLLRKREWQVEGEWQVDGDNNIFHVWFGHPRAIGGKSICVTKYDSRGEMVFNKTIQVAKGKEDAFNVKMAVDDKNNLHIAYVATYWDGTVGLYYLKVDQNGNIVCGPTKVAGGSSLGFFGSILFSIVACVIVIADGYGIYLIYTRHQNQISSEKPTEKKPEERRER